jgi:hypothetical protein
LKRCGIWIQNSKEKKDKMVVRNGSCRSKNNEKHEKREKTERENGRGRELISSHPL